MLFSLTPTWLLSCLDSIFMIALLRHAFGHQGVGGFEVIERAKARLEDECGGVVSCADIVAMAARDAIALSNGPAYDVPTGRRDGGVSNVSLADDMPDVSDSIQQLKTKFFLKGLSDKDLVLLSGIYFSLSLSSSCMCGDDMVGVRTY
ncbi:hypothetical protein QYF36_013497 [Acer negundo]|nr:hypothetical protein QYF36_013497 [Acer negundo]